VSSALSAEDRRAAAEPLDGPEGVQVLEQLVSIAPTNLEDPVHQRWEKPNYPVAAEFLLRLAREWGFAAQIYDPVDVTPSSAEFHGIARPNVIVDLDAGAAETVLILAHYDVVPVPPDQLTRWRSPPHTLTARADGRLYARGANDDLGSGVVASLLALRAIAEGKGGSSARNVRLLLCCDEETGGEGGIEAIKAHDAALPPEDKRRILRADVALIPDGSPHVCAGSSGVLFVDAGFESPVPAPTVVEYGRELVRLNDLLRSWKSQYDSADWPDHGAPEKVITGRATVTKFDLVSPARGALRPRLTRLHAETEATNLIPESVTFVFEGPGEKLLELGHWLPRQVPAPFRLMPTPQGGTALSVPTGALALSLVGRGAHGGYPHLAHNPVPAAIELLEEALANAKIEEEPLVSATFGVDVRLPPEMALEKGKAEALRPAEEWIARHPVGAFLVAPPGRQRGGYALPPSNAMAKRLERILAQQFHVTGIFGEYGGTDASSLVGVETPAGTPIPALVFGSMDRSAHIHEAEESVDPKLLGGVVRTLVEFVREP
jgi:acetylornithine deacetylase/succinyl-diaminopimelate desuccinylase-like protein